MVPPGSDAALDYRTDASQRPLIWIGQGLHEFGIEPGSLLTEAQYPMARRLMAGQHLQTGEQLLTLKTVIAPEAKLPAAPLHRAIVAAATDRGITAEELFTSARKLTDWKRLVAGVQRVGETHRVPATQLGTLADAAGISPADVWGEQEFTEALRHADQRVVVGNRGFDIGLDLPKSFSVLWAYAPEDLAGKLEKSFVDATLNTIGWLEPRVAYAMRGHHGDGRTATTIPTEGLMGWAMFHRTARPVAGEALGDPHFHAHVTIANLAHGQDGKWSTIGAGGRELYRHTKAIGELAQARIRHDTTAELGIEWERHPHTGQWEVVGIPESTLKMFSKRNLEIRGLLIELGFDPDTAGRVHHMIAAAITREAKPPPSLQLTDSELRDYYRARAVEAGEPEPDLVIRRTLTPELIPDSDRRVPVDERVHPRTAEDLAEVVFDPEYGLTSHDKVFNRINLIAGIANSLPSGAATPTEIEQLADEVLALPDHTVKLPAGAKTPSHLVDATRYTTTDIVNAEKTIFASARTRYGEGAAEVPADTVEMAIEVFEAGQAFHLSAEQRQVLRRLLCDGHGVDAVVGVAGAGKTTIMSVARIGWQMHGKVVVGAATAAVAAHNLENESGIYSMTVAAWRHRINNTFWGLTGVDVLVVDEAGMTDDRDMALLTKEAAAKGVKLVGIGDPKQLRSPGVGGSFAAVHHLVEGETLNENRRQRNPLHRQALQSWRDKKYTQAMGDLSQVGALRVRRDQDTSMAAMLNSWARHRTQFIDPFDSIDQLVMLAKTNAAVDRLNAGAQYQRLADGEISSAEHTTITTLGGQELRFHLGDQVLIRKNDYRSRTREGHARGATDVLNGVRGIVTGIDEHQRVVVSWREADAVGEPAVHTETLDRDYIARDGLRLGYAITIHKSQGLTIDQVVLGYLTGAEDANDLYVLASRHKNRLELYGSYEDLVSQAQQAAAGARTDAERRRLVQQAIAANAAQTPEDLLVTAELDKSLLISVTGRPFRPEEDDDGQQDAVERLEPEEQDWLTQLDQALANTLAADRAWPTLAQTLEQVAETGADPARVLARATAARELATADNLAATLSWRVNNWLEGQPYIPWDTHATWDEAAAHLPPEEPETATESASTERAASHGSSDALTGDVAGVGQHEAARQAALAHARAAAAITARPYGLDTDDELTARLTQARRDADAGASGARTAARAADDQAEQAAAGRGDTARAVATRYQRLTEAAHAINELRTLDKDRDRLTAATAKLDRELARHAQMLAAVDRRGRPKLTDTERDDAAGRLQHLRRQRDRLDAELEDLDLKRTELQGRAGPAHQHAAILADHHTARTRLETDLQRATFIDQQDADLAQRQATLRGRQADRMRKHVHELRDELQLRQSLRPADAQLEQQARHQLRTRIPAEPVALDASTMEVAEPEAARTYPELQPEQDPSLDQGL